MFNVKWVYPIKKALYLISNIAPRGLECGNNKSWPGNLSQVLNFTFGPCFKVKWGHHTNMSLFLPYYRCYGFRI